MTDSLDILRAATAQLMEHFDSCRIVCTKHEGGQTKSATYGGGNWYAQRASIESWLRDDDQRERTYSDVCERQRLEGE